MLAFLGWNPGTTQEIFSMQELIDAFSLDRVGKAGAKFDPDKTKWFQQQYLKHTDDATLADLLMQEFTINAPKERVVAFCKLMKERATFVRDMMSEGAYMFEAPVNYDEQTVSKKWKADSAALMTEWKGILAGQNTFDAPSIETAFKSFLETKGLGIGAVLPLFRLLLTGVGMGPSMFEITAFLGKEESLQRMEKGINTLG
jgi:glutamyl-tRNA synthetase